MSDKHIHAMAALNLALLIALIIGIVASGTIGGWAWSFVIWLWVFTGAYLAIYILLTWIHTRKKKDE